MVTAGMILIFASLGLHLMQEQRDSMAGQNAQILMEQLALSKNTPIVPTESDLPEPEAPESSEAPEMNSSVMPEKEYMGYAMIGSLRVPSVGIELPILSSWDYDLLNVTACRYSGSIATGDLILLGHNYKSHLGPLRNVQIGDLLEFESVNGVTYRYVVAQVEQLHKSEGERLSADYALSVFTCTLGGNHRIVVRCNPAEES